MSFHLRPVKEASPSPSSTASASPTDDRQSSASAARSRRPLSPSSLRDVDLTHSPDTNPRKYPAPPTGHDLMAMFPPRPPSNFGNRPEPTSRYFQPQERSFFAQPGKEIVRVHVEVDLPRGETLSENAAAKARVHRTWPNSGHSPAPSVVSLTSNNAHRSPSLQRSSPPSLGPYPSSNPASRPPPRGPAGPVPSAAMFPQMPPHPGPSSSQQPPNLHSMHAASLRTDPQGTATGSKQDLQGEDYRENDDEAWRTPMPYNERRRAGKHTRRVIIRN